MKFCLKSLVVATLVAGSVHARAAANNEAPPMEPPYTNGTEFDPVLGEDPAASSAPIPTSNSPTDNAGVPPTTDDIFAPSPAEKKPKKVSTTSSGSSSSSSDKFTSVFDQPSAEATNEKGVKLIHHPDAKKGLIRIEADGTYIYKVKTTPKNQTGSVRFGMMDPPNIKSADGYTDFKGMYGSGSVPTLMFDYEWQPFSSFGKLGVQGGFDLAISNGNGHFLKDGGAAQEKYTFIAIPLNLGVIYRLEYFRRQWIVPYVAGGGSYIGVAEMRDDNKNNFSGTPAAYGAAGLMFSLTAIDKSMAFELDSEYGVGALWVVAEYRYQKAFSEDLDYTGGVMSVGISADF